MWNCLNSRVRYSFLILFLILLAEVRAQSAWFPNYTGKIEIHKEEMEWLGVDNLYDTNSSERSLWIIRNDSSVFKYITFDPRNSRYDVVDGIRHIGFNTPDSTGGEYFNYVGDAQLPPMLIRNLYRNSGDYFHDLFLKSLGLDSLYEDSSRYYLYAENASYSYEAEGKIIDRDEVKIELVYGLPERKDWKRHVYHLRLSQDKLDAEVSWLLEDSLFAEKNLRRYAANGQKRMEGQRMHRDSLTRAYIEQSMSNPVDLRYHYFVNVRSKAGVTFPSFFTQDSVLLMVYLNAKGIAHSRHLKLLQYYLTKYPDTKLNYILLIDMNGLDEVEGLSDELLAHSYPISKYERNRLGMSEAQMQIVNSEGKEVYKTGGISKFFETLNTYW